MAGLPLPPHLLFKILDRMNTISLCRMRQACHMIDDFVEKHRFQLSRRRTDSPWILKIQATVICGTEVNNISINTAPCSKYNKQNRWLKLSEKSLEDTFAQLSAVSLYAVEVYDFLISAHFHSPQMRLTNQTLDLLQKLRPDVKWLTVRCNFTPELSAAVRFSKLYVHSDKLSLSTFTSSGIQNCRELAWMNGYLPSTEEFISILDHLEVLTISWRSASKEYEQTCLENLMEYLKKKEGRTLKRIRILPCTFGKELHLEDLNLLHSFPFLNIYKVNIKRGVAYFRYSNRIQDDMLEIRLFEKESRMSLLETVLQSEPGEIKDNAIVKPFMEAADEAKALESLQHMM